VQLTLDALADPRFPADPARQERRPDRRDAARGWRRPRRRSSASSISDDLWNEDFLERHLAAHLNEVLCRGLHRLQTPA